MTIREFFESGSKGGFAQQLLRTYDDPCDGNFRLLRAVADGRNSLLVDDAEYDVQQFQNNYSWRTEYAWQVSLRHYFPMLLELDRELDQSDFARLPRESAKEEPANA